MVTIISTIVNRKYDPKCMYQSRLSLKHFRLVERQEIDCLHMTQREDFTQSLQQTPAQESIYTTIAPTTSRGNPAAFQAAAPPRRTETFS